MKRFAITPDTRESGYLARLIACLPERGVDCVYIRTALTDGTLETIAGAVQTAGMLPIIHHRRAHACAHLNCGLHVKSHELDMLARVPRAGRTVTAACHDAHTAEAALGRARADYVFVSPVFQPHSKPRSRRPLVPLADIKHLVRGYGERVVLLGGMTMQRVSDMQHELGADFSFAGISMFFPEPAGKTAPGSGSRPDGPQSDAADPCRTQHSAGAGAINDNRPD